MSSQKRFSKEGFQQLPNKSSPKMATNPNDATIDIPMSAVPNQTSARTEFDTSPPVYVSEKQPPSPSSNEKAGLFHRNAAGRRRVEKTEAPGKKGDDGEEEIITQMGRIYNKILNFSVVTRYFLYVLPIAIIIALPMIIGATAAQNAAIGDGHGVRIVWLFAWLEIVWLSLWVSKLVAQFLPAIFTFLCGVVSSGTRKYALVIEALEIPLSLTGWALASLATFTPIMTRNPTQRKLKDTSLHRWESIVNSILSAFFVASLVFLLEKLLVQLISISYHRKQFNLKIKESKHNIYLLSLLYDASRNLFPAYCNEFAEEDYIINDSIELTTGNSGSGHHSGTATPMRLIQNMGRVGDKVTSLFGNIAHEVTGKQVFNPGSAHSIVVEALEKNRSAEALAKRLWMSFVVEGKDALYHDDIVEVLGAEKHVEAEECFASLDRDANGDISLDEMILTICEFGRERHSIANSLHDVDQAINVLDKLLCTVVFLIVIFIFVGFLNSSLWTQLATTGTVLLSLSFVFATTAQEVLGSCIFLFVKHPYDVLDRVDVNDDQLVVEHISLLYTTFRKISTNKLTQVPNIVLNSLWIQNISRSKAMKERLQMYISFDTSLEDVQLLRNEMQAFVLDKENSRDFQPDIDVEITGLSEMNKMELTVEIRHKSNWANETVRAARRSKFMCALVLALRKIPINAPGGGDAALGSVDKPSYSVTVADSQAAANRDAYAKSQEAKRLVPSKKPEAPQVPPKDSGRGKSSGNDTPTLGDMGLPSPLRFRNSPTTETSALNNLNNRHPAADTATSPRDYVEPTTPKSTRSGTMTLPDADRENDIEEVRGMLSRSSTRGKRKAVNSADYKSYPPQTLDPYLQQAQRYHQHDEPQQPSPQARRPVPGSNASAQQAKDEKNDQGPHGP